MIRKQKWTKAALAARLGISRSGLYYVSKQFPKDWMLKAEIEKVLEEHPSYGSPRVAQALRVNEKRAARVMRRFGMKAYRRRGRKFRKSGVAKTAYPNLLKTYVPKGPGDVWVADFTYIPWKGTFLYLATVLDAVTREVLGYAVMANHSVALTLESLFHALAHHARPFIFHSDNGREYGAKAFIAALMGIGVRISRSKKGCPQENGMQEAFFSQFKVDLGDPNRFKTLGELVYEVHRLVWDYNHRRIHTALKMPPALFAERWRQWQKLIEKVS